MGSYLPGTKSAGVTMSVSQMVKNLSPNVIFNILTEDRDIGDEEPYKNVELETWTTYKEANVFYSQKYIQSLSYFKKVICKTDFDVYYINGFYNLKDNARFFLLYWLKLIPQKPIVIAPRGIFSMGEYSSHNFIRKIYRRLFEFSGLLKNTIWHATAQMEEKDIRDGFLSNKLKIEIIPNMNDTKILDKPSDLEKQEGELKILFISRISAKKNIKLALNALKNVKGNVVFDIYGMIGTEEDHLYWKECENIIASLPQNIKCEYHGEVAHSKTAELFQKHHVFLFPTHGENYGHVIAESIANGCPLIISDKTPWNDIEQNNAGYVIPLKEESKYSTILQKFADMNQTEWNSYQQHTLQYADHHLDSKEISKKYLNFFLNL